MKKLFIAAAAIAFVSMALYSCSLLKSLEEVKKSGFICSNYSLVPVNEMGRQEVVKMVRNYYNNQYQALHDVASSSKLTGLPANCPVDSRAVFFNLDTLKKLIYYIEKGSSGFSAADKQNLGLNVYFASYPESFHKTKPGYNYASGSPVLVPYDYTNRHTLIFIPSIFSNTELIAKDIDLNANLTGIYSNPVFLDSSFFRINPGGQIRRMVAAGDGASSLMMIQNNGSTIPPPKAPTGSRLLDLTDPH